MTVLEKFLIPPYSYVTSTWGTHSNNTMHAVTVTVEYEEIEEESVADDDNDSQDEIYDDE